MRVCAHICIYEFPYVWMHGCVCMYMCMCVSVDMCVSTHKTLINRYSCVESFIFQYVSSSILLHGTFHQVIWKVQPYYCMLAYSRGINYHDICNKEFHNSRISGPDQLAVDHFQDLLYWKDRYIHVGRCLLIIIVLYNIK